MEKRVRVSVRMEGWMEGGKEEKTCSRDRGKTDKEYKTRLE